MGVAWPTWVTTKLTTLVTSRNERARARARVNGEREQSGRGDTYNKAIYSYITMFIMDRRVRIKEWSKSRSGLIRQDTDGKFGLAVLVRDMWYVVRWRSTEHKVDNKWQWQWQWQIRLNMKEWETVSAREREDRSGVRGKPLVGCVVLVGDDSLTIIL